jgi:hypothetical protein
MKLFDLPKMFSLLAEPKFANEQEYQFSIASIVARERTFAQIYFMLSIGSPFFVLGLWLAGLAGNSEFYVTMSAQVLQALIGIYFLRARLSTALLRFACLYSFIAMQLAWTVGARLTVDSGAPSQPFAGLWIFHIFAGCLLLPFRSHVHHFMFGFLFGTTVFGLYGYPDLWVGIGAVLIAQLTGANMQILAHRFLKRLTILQYREQSRYVPRHVLLKTAREGLTIEKVFGPKNRFCVCICSDWRNFQSVAIDENAQILGERLAEYYNRITDRLSKDIDDGKFFMDWIADELFVVIFSDDEKADPALVEKGFDFSIWLLSHRRSFSREFGYPSGIDVGVSAGVASVGIFGPTGGIKATAFGLIPGYARRLQGLAKQLRVDYGDQDRVVISTFAAETIEAENAQCSRLELKDAYEVRDITEDAAFVWPKLTWQVGKYGSVDSAPFAHSGPLPQQVPSAKRPA